MTYIHTGNDPVWLLAVNNLFLYLKSRKTINGSERV